MKPLIGVPLRSDVTDDGRCTGYLFDPTRRGLQRAGAFVVPIAAVQDIDYYATPNSQWPALSADELADMERALDMVDGLFVPGGHKFCQYDRVMLELAIQRDLPVLAVCLGMQMLSVHGEDQVAFPLVEHQDLHHNRTDTYAHKVTIAPDSKLFQVIGEAEIPVNSWHRRGASDNAVYRSVAWAEDGLVEAMELPGARFNLGVQWHPESLYGKDEYANRLMDAFLEEARRTRQLRG